MNKLTAAKIDAMGKTELRVACKENGIQYGKLTVGGMRDALKALNVESASTEPANAQEEVAAPAKTNSMSHSVNQLLCNGNGNSKPAPAKRTPAPAKEVSAKIEKDRPEQHGIKRPSAGGMCRAVWDACDEFRTTNDRSPTAKEIKAIAETKGWNANNASIELYQWRKFNGLTKAAK